MYVVSLKQFDGPLDLLLSLVQHAKIDIQDIFVSQITEQYLESMAGVDELDMDSASEFLAMAATLMEIKSRALLPAPPEPEEEGEESPEQALIRQLTEYKAFKELSQDMRKLEDEARDLISKLPEEYPLPPPPVELTGLTLEALSRAFLRVLARAREEESEVKERSIRREEFTVQNCMLRIQSRLRRGPVRFSELFSARPERVEVISVFLGLLELLRLNRAHAAQEDMFGEIIITAATVARDD